MRILLFEDEEQLAKNMQDVLLQEKYQAEICLTGTEGNELALTEEYDLILLDIMLPGMDGLSILKNIRNEGIATPVLLLTARGAIEDKVKGLDYGADDYLTKPFAIPELLARIRSLLRRQSEATSSEIKIKNLSIDTSARTVELDGGEINLTSKEYSILEYLVYNKNRAVSRLSIAEHIWGDNMDLFKMTNFVDVHIKNLRKKLSHSKENSIIFTVRGIGYIIKDEV
jgi:DNA-binding response OmpR family regulator